MSQISDKICDRLSELVADGKLSNADMVQIIAHLGSYLNLQTRTNWAKEHGKTYNAAKNFRQNVTLFGMTFVIDND